jgi:phenylacetate-CoA ligase
MSAYHLTPANLRSYLEAMQAARVQYVWGHSSALDALARAAKQNPQLRPNLRVILSSSEPLTARQRRNIAEGFQCPARATYGMSEMVVAASECVEGHRLHLWPDAGYAEVLDRDAPVPAGTPGDLVATCLVNWDMPLIRYRVGDRIALDAGSAGCACGRCLPGVARIEGRISDMLFTASGACLSPTAMEAVFDFDAPILESQLVQESLHLVRVLYVPAGRPDPAVEADLRNRIQARMGDIQVLVEPVAEIKRGPNGKFRAVICKLRREDIASMAQAGTGDLKKCVPTA